jgi:hypothetical protein
MEYKPQPRPARPDAEVLVGLQLEDGLRIEQKVRVDTTELALKRTLWEVLNPPEGHYHLHIQNSRNEDAEKYTISRPWTYISRKQPKQWQQEKGAASGSTVSVRLKATWNQFDRHVNANTAWSEERRPWSSRNLRVCSRSWGAG